MNIDWVKTLVRIKAKEELLTELKSILFIKDDFVFHLFMPVDKDISSEDEGIWKLTNWGCGFNPVLTNTTEGNNTLSISFFTEDFPPYAFLDELKSKFKEALIEYQSFMIEDNKLIAIDFN